MRPSSTIRLLIIMLLLTGYAGIVAAANNPGHDSLYVLKLGDNMTGTFNISGNLTATLVQATGRFFGPQLEIRADGNPSTYTPNRIFGDTTDLTIDSTGIVYLKKSTGGQVVIGSVAVPASLNVSGNIYSKDQLVCLANGSNCPSSMSGANITGTGSSGYLSRWTSGTNLGNSIIYDDGTNIGIGDTNPSEKLRVVGNMSITGNITMNGSVVCTASNGLCGSGNGNVSGVGTTGTLTKWTGTGIIGNSMVSESGSTLTINGNISMPNNFWIGNGASAPYQYSTAIGYQANAGQWYSIALGYQANATANPSIAIGRGTNATASGTLSIGDYSNSAGTNSISLGANSKSTQTGTIALGSSSQASAFYALAIGSQSTASQQNANAIGYQASATGTQANAIGYLSTATASDSIAIGTRSNSTVSGAIALGQYAQATGIAATASGNQSLAADNQATAYGAGTHALLYGTAIGYQANATGSQATATGYLSKSNGSNSLALGYNAKGYGPSSIAIGNQAQASALSAIAIGGSATASNNYSFAIGTNSATTTENQFMVGSASQNLNTYIYGNLTVTSNITALNIYDNGNRVCTAANGLCGSGGGSGGGWTNTTQQVSLSNTANNVSANILFVDNTNGRVGVGTTNPTTKFEISDVGTPRLTITDTTTPTSLQLISTDTESIIRTSTTHPLSFGVGGTNYITINTSGNVGIGTTAPSQKLEVNGNMLATDRFLSQYVGSTSWSWYATNTTYVLIMPRQTNYKMQGTFYFNRGTNTAMSRGGSITVNIDDTNYTTLLSPTWMIEEINGHNANWANIQLANVTYAGNQYWALKFPTGTDWHANTVTFVGHVRGGLTNVTWDYYSNESITEYSSRYSPIVKTGETLITGINGNVGVGTTTPSSKLEVAGNINVSGTGNCVILPGGGKVCGNSTCTYIVSPNGATTLQACNS